MTIFHRHLLRELLIAALFTFAALMAVVLMLVFSIAAMRSSFASLGIFALAKVALFLGAGRLDVLIPLTVFVSCLWTYGRAQSDREITAMRGAGIGLRQLLMPGLAIGAVGTLLLAFAQDQALPEAHYQQLLIGRREFAKTVSQVLESESRVIHQGKFKCIWSHVTEDKGAPVLHDVVVVERDEGEEPTVTRAREARPTLVTATGELRLELIDFIRDDILSSDKMTIGISLRAVSSDRPPHKRVADFSYDELMTRARRFRGGKYGHRARAELSRRAAVALSPLLFALLGCPLGMILRITNRAVVLAIGFFTLLVCHFAPLAVGVDMAEKGAPLILVWLSSLIVGALAFRALWKARRR